MKTILVKYILLTFLSTLILSSCTVQKRRYSSGFHVNWHLNKIKSSNLFKKKSNADLAGTSRSQDTNTIADSSQNTNLALVDSIPVKDETTKKKHIEKNPSESSYAFKNHRKNKLKHRNKTKSESVSYALANSSELNITDESKPNKTNLDFAPLEQDMFYYQTKVDSQTVLTPADFSPFLVGIPILVTGLVLPHPSNKPREMTEKQSKNKKTALGIGIGLAIILIIVAIIFIALLITAVSAFGGV